MKWTQIIPRYLTTYVIAVGLMSGSVVRPIDRKKTTTCIIKKTEELTSLIKLIARYLCNRDNKAIGEDRDRHRSYRLVIG